MCDVMFLGVACLLSLAVAGSDELSEAGRVGGKWGNGVITQGSRHGMWEVRL